MEKEADVMSTYLRSAEKHSGSSVAGSVTLALGILFTTAVGYTFLLSLSDAVDPPTWVRAIGLVWLPIGLGGIPIAYYLARTGDGRERGRLGVLIGLAGLVAFIALVSAIG